MNAIFELSRRVLSSPCRELRNRWPIQELSYSHALRKMVCATRRALCASMFEEYQIQAYGESYNMGVFESI